MRVLKYVVIRFDWVAPNPIEPGRKRTDAGGCLRFLLMIHQNCIARVVHDDGSDGCEEEEEEDGRITSDLTPQPCEEE